MNTFRISLALLSLILFLCPKQPKAQNTQNKLKQQINSAMADTTKSRLFLELGLTFHPDQPDSSLFYYTKAEALSDSNSAFYDRCILEKGRSYYVLSKYPESMNAFLSIAKRQYGKRDTLALASAYNGIGLIYSIQSEPDLAISSHRKSIKLAKLIQDKSVLTRNFLNLSIAFKDKNQLDSSMLYAQKNLEASIQLKDTFMIAMAFNRLAYTEYLLGNYQKALEISNRFEKTIKNINNWEKTFLFSIKANCNYQLDHYNIALKQAQTAYLLALKSKSVWEIKRSTDILSRAYAANFQMDSAYKFLLLHKAFSDTIYNEDKQNHTNFMLFKQQELENKILTHLNLISSQKLKVQTLQIFITLIILVALFSIAMILLINNRHKQQHNEKLTKLNQQIHKQSELLEESYKKLQDLSQFKQDTNAMIVHDMKNWLNIVIGLGKHDLVVEAGRNLLNLSTNILDIDKFEQAKIKLDKQLTPIMLLLNDAKKETAYFASIAEVELIIKTETDTNINVDYEIIKRSIVNLLTNAIKYSKKGKQVIIEAQPIADSQIQVKVTDFGTGISKKNLPYIFDKYFQAKQQSNELHVSTGIGLSFCKMAVEAHNGTIKVESEQKTKTTFSFTLPIAK